MQLVLPLDFGTKTCGGYPGSIFDMQKDAQVSLSCQSFKYFYCLFSLNVCCKRVLYGILGVISFSLQKQATLNCVLY